MLLTCVCEHGDFIREKAANLAAQLGGESKMSNETVLHMTQVTITFRVSVCVDMTSTTAIIV